MLSIWKAGWRRWWRPSSAVALEEEAKTSHSEPGAAGRRILCGLPLGDFSEGVTSGTGAWSREDCEDIRSGDWAERRPSEFACTTSE